MIFVTPELPQPSTHRPFCVICGDAATMHVEGFMRYCTPHAPSNAVALVAPKSTFVKHDGTKLPLDLLPFDALETVADVLAYGAQKYAPDQWRGCTSQRRYFAAALRHLFAWARGETNDTESALPHLAHAACCVLFMLALPASADDRAKP